MITPILIQVLFWMGTAVLMFAGFRMIVSSFQSYEETNSVDEAAAKRQDGAIKPPKWAATTKKTDFAVFEFMTGIALAIVGPFVLRVYCELAIIFFRIHDELKESNDRNRR